MAKEYPEYRWRDCAMGDVRNRNNVMLAEEVTKKIPPDRRECYCTIFRFPDAYKEHFDRDEGGKKPKGSVKGYAGPAYADWFWVDVDEADLEKAKTGALAVYLTLTTWGCDPADSRVYFSGTKGFHVGVPSATFAAAASTMLPRIFGEMALRLQEESGVTLDLSIYKHNSFLRLPNTINAKSGLFKVGLADTELGDLTIEEIQTLAKEPRAALPPGPHTPNRTMADIYNQAALQVADRREGQKDDSRRVAADAGLAEFPKYDKVCLYRMMKGVSSGQRNNAGLRISVHLRQKGLPLAMTRAALVEWNRLNEEPLEEVDVLTLADRAYENVNYDFGCHDPVLDAFCFKQCKFYAAKTGEDPDAPTSIYSVPELGEKYRQYIRDLNKAKVSWGIEWLDRMTRGLAPGQVGCLMARAGVGKTALILNTLRANSELGIPSLLCSLEQLGAEIYERMVSNAAEVEGLAVELGFYQEQQASIDLWTRVVEHRFARTYVCDDDRLTVRQLKERVRAAEEKAGEKIRLLCVDYLGRMKGEGRDYYQKISELALGLKQVAKECQLAVLVVVQVNRSGGKGSVEVTMDMARDSGQVEEAVDYAVGMWRAASEEQGRGTPVTVLGPDGAPIQVPDCQDHYPVNVQINKNRKGPAGENVRCGLVFRPRVMCFEQDLRWKPAPKAASTEGQEEIEVLVSGE